MLIDLSQLNDTELGRIVRASMSAQALTRITMRSGALADVAEHAADEKEALKVEAVKERKKLALKGFLVGPTKYVVPALNAKDELLDSLVPANVLSPYNRARHSLGENHLIDPEDATWRFLVAEHVRLAAKAQAAPVQIAVDLDAKASAVSRSLGVSLDEARQIMERTAR